jgi:recombination protein RecA
MVVRRKKPTDDFSQFMVTALKGAGEDQEAVDMLEDFSQFMVTALKGAVEDQEAVDMLEDFQDLPPVKEWIPCELADLNRVVSGGRGLPVGRAIELFGKEKSGKSAIALTFATQAINDGGPVLWIDAEHSLNPEHTKPLRRTGRFFRVRPDTMEECWECIWTFLKMLKAKGQTAPGLIVWDSIAMTPTKGELDGKEEMAGQARVMSRNSRRGRKRIARSRCAVIFVNQVRTKIGGMSYGDNTVRPCGMALDFMCDAMIKNTIVKTDSVGSGDDAEANGYHIKSQAVKSRFARPMSKTVWYLSFDVGPDAATTAMMYLKNAKLLKAGGGRTPSLMFKTDGGDTSIPTKDWRSYFTENKKVIDQLLVDLASKDDKPQQSVADDDEDEEPDTDTKKPRAPAPVDDDD